MMNKGGLLYGNSNEVPPTLLLLEKLTIVILQPQPVPVTHIMKGGAFESPCHLVALEALGEGAAIGVQNEVMERP